MTGEEMERAIEFLLQGQARAEARQDRTDQQITEMGKQITEMGRHIAEMSNRIQTYADTQSQFIEITTRTLVGLAASQERTDKRIAETNARIAESNAHLAERLAESRALADETNAHLAQLAAMQAETDQRLNRLVALVERNITGGSGNLEQ